MVSDGHLTLPAGILGPTAPPEEFAALMTEIHGNIPETVTPAANVALLRTGEEVVLVDNGSGNKFQPTAGKPSRTWRRLGSTRPPSPGSCSRTPTPTTSGARFVTTARWPSRTPPITSRSRWDFWTDPDLPAQMPEDLRPFALGAQRDLAAVEERVTLVKDGDSIAPGVSVIDTPGHTPGYIALLVEGGEGLIIAADAYANEIVSLRRPDWAFGFDADPELAIATCKALLDRRRPTGCATSASTLPTPASASSSATATGFRFVPA